MTRDHELGFANRYGPWALVVGASEGIGAEFARAVGRLGLNVALVARRPEALDDVAATIRAETGVDVRTVAVDLTADLAATTIIDAVSDVGVGLVCYAAGGDPNYEPFLSQPVDNAVALVERNCLAPLRLCHHFAAPMRARGRGGLVLVSSGAGLVGGRNMVAYAATKAFDMVMAEALWAELHGDGVDVLGLVLGVTDTPALRRTLLRRGQLADATAPIPGAAPAGEVVAEALANLAEGPICFATEDVREGAKHLGAMSRNDAVRMLLAVGAGVMGSDEEVPQ
jgi:uncharacterized protein